jgi:hypothetical protein
LRGLSTEEKERKKKEKYVDDKMLNDSQLGRGEIFLGAPSLLFCLVIILSYSNISKFSEGPIRYKRERERYFIFGV